MQRYAIKQLFNMALTLLAVSLLVFMLNEWTPGDVVSKLLGPYANQDQVEKVTRGMGLDRPAFVRQPPVRHVPALPRDQRGVPVRNALGHAEDVVAAHGQPIALGQALLGVVALGRAHQA